MAAHALAGQHGFDTWSIWRFAGLPHFHRDALAKRRSEWNFVQAQLYEAAARSS